MLIYLPNAPTELSIRQAIGRVVRTAGPDDGTRAYVVMPSLDTLEQYARRVEEEILPAAQESDKAPTNKRCPVCAHECARGEGECPSCGHEFPVVNTRFKSCPDCGALNPVTISACQTCGSEFTPSFKFTLDEALRTGAIARGMDFDEEEVQLSESIAPRVRARILKSGDQKLVRCPKYSPRCTCA